MNKLAWTGREIPALALLLDTYKAEFEIMCIQFLSGGWKLTIRHSVMALYRMRDQVPPGVGQQLTELLTTDGDTVRALLALAQARCPAELQVCDAQLRRLRRRHTQLVIELHQQACQERA